MAALGEDITERREAERKIKRLNRVYAMLSGINTLILTQSGGNEGLGFAAPSNIVRNVFEQIRATGRVRRGEIGVVTVAGNIIDAINHPQRIFPIGRLDKDSEGLILLTSNGDIVNEILRSENNHEKEYTVTVNRPITDRFIERMGNGVPILDTVTRKCKVEQISKYTFKIILTQGLNRQIRYMCRTVGLKVLELKRIALAEFILADLAEGCFKTVCLNAK